MLGNYQVINSLQKLEALSFLEYVVEKKGDERKAQLTPYMINYVEGLIEQ